MNEWCRDCIHYKIGYEHSYICEITNIPIDDYSDMSDCVMKEVEDNDFYNARWGKE